ncbi:MAG: serine/threonine-protein kinase [Zavarzinella sp.]
MSKWFCQKCVYSTAVEQPGQQCPDCGAPLTAIPQETNSDTSSLNTVDQTLNTITLVESQQSQLPKNKYLLKFNEENEQELKDAPTFPGYRVLEVLGEGGMGRVYRALQLSVGRMVAIKCIFRSYYQEDIARFQREAHAISKLQSDKIVQVIDFQLEASIPFMTMEYIEGVTLSRLLDLKDLSLSEIITIMASVLEALQVAHEQGILHRDVKPSNILLTTDLQQIKLTDFGIAKLPDDPNSPTLSGQLIGTPKYMSPEQARLEETLTPASDIFSAGVVLHQMLSGRVPYEGMNKADTLEKLKKEPLPDVRASKPEIPARLAAIVTKACSLNIDDRYISAAQFRDDLLNWQAGKSTIASPLSFSERTFRWLRRRWKLTAVAVLIPTVLLAAMIIRRELEPITSIHRSLRNEKPTLLVGETGFPKYFLWELGDTVLMESTRGDRSASFQTQTLSLLSLLDDPQCDEYTIELEIAHHQKVVDPGSYVGIYLNLVRIRADDGTPCISFVALKWSDFLETIEQQMPAVAAKHSVRIQRYVAFQRGDWQHRLINLSPNPPMGLFFPADVRYGWRKMKLEVSPSGIEVEFEKTKGITAKVHIPPENMEVKGDLGQNHFTLKDGGKVHYPAWNPRGSFGIYSSNATVAFRNVVVTPKISK